MATRSTIAIENYDGTVSQVYCHWDGYLENNGVLLMKHYNSPELVKQLVSLGSISHLEQRIEPKGKHSFSSPEEGTTVFYHRDRGEELRINEFANMANYTKKFGRQEVNYLYSASEQRWYVSFERGFDGLETPFIPLADALKKENVPF